MKARVVSRFGDFCYLVGLGIRERWGRVFLTATALAFAVAISTIALVYGWGGLRQAISRAEAAFPKGLLTVRPRTLDVVAFRFNATVLSDKEVRAIEQLPGVEFVAPQLSLKMPLRAEGEIMGQTATTDIVVVGIEPRLIKSDVEPGYTFDYDSQTSLPIPCVVPRFFIDMYNLAYADSLGLPKISESYPIGKQFNLIIGETYLWGGTGAKAITLPGRIVGLTSQSPLMVGLIIPLGHAKALNEWYQGRAQTAYSAAHVKLADLSSYDAVTSAIMAMGLSVENPGETLEKFILVARVGMFGVGLFCVLVSVVAAVGIFNTYSLAMMLRRGELVVLRAVGATRSYVFRLLLADSFVVGLFAGVLAGGLCDLLRWGIQSAMQTLVTALPVSLANVELPGRLLLYVLSAGGAVLLSLIVTFPLAWRYRNVRLVSGEDT